MSRVSPELFSDLGPTSVISRLCFAYYASWQTSDSVSTPYLLRGTVDVILYAATKKKGKEVRAMTWILRLNFT